MKKDTVRTFWGLIAAGLGIAAFGRAGVSWDGSVYLFNLLNDQRMFAPHSRYINLLLQWPVLLLSAVAGNTALLQIGIGLIYAALPLAALATCWWIARRDAPSLFVWAALGIALVMLPGVFNVVAEANIAIWLFWPLVLAVLIGIPRRVVPLAIVLGLLLFVTHPSAVLLFGVVAAVAFVLGLRAPEQRRHLWLWAAGFAGAALVALVRFALGNTPYERDQLSLGIYGWSFGVSVWGAPFVALACAAIVAASMIAAPRLLQRQNERSGDMIRRVAVASVLLAGAVLAWWAHDPNQWKWANKYTLWAPWISACFAGIALLDRLMWERQAPPQEEQRWAFRRRLLPPIGAVFLVVLAIQSTAWTGVLRRLEGTLTDTSWACVSSAPVNWLNDTPLNQFGTPALALVLQGRTPAKLMVPNDDCGTQTFGDGYRLDDYLTRPWQSAWFRFDQLHTRLVGEQQYAENCSFALTTGWYQTETNGPYWWRWSDGKHAAMRVVLAKGGSVAFTGQIESREQPNTITVLVNGTPQTTIDVTWTGLRALAPVQLKLAQGVNTVQFVSQRSPVPTQGRLLAFDLSNVTMVNTDQPVACRFHT